MHNQQNTLRIQGPANIDAIASKYLSKSTMNSFKHVLNWLVLPGMRWSWSEAVTLWTIPANIDDLRSALSNRRPGKAVDVVLAENLVLRKTHKLPRKARGQASKVLDLRSDALGKASQSSLIGASVLVKRGANEDVYEQFLVRTSDLDVLQRLCLEADVPLRSVSVEADGTHAFFLNAVAEIDRPISRWWGVTTMLAVAICLVSIFMEASAANEKRRQLDLMRAELSELQSELDIAASAGDTKLVEHQRLTNLVQKMSEHQRITRHLSMLTSALPDDVWLSEFVALNNQIRMAGVSSIDPISIIAALEAEEWIASVSLARPVRKDGLTQLSNFELLLDIESGSM